MTPFPKVLKAVLVDFDGTFVDSMPALWGCFRAFLGGYGVAATEAEFHQLIGPSLPEVVGTLKRKYALKPDLDDLQKEYTTLVSKAYAKRVSTFPDALKVLQKAKQRGLKLALVTSAPLELVGDYLEHCGLQNFFDALITSQKEEPTKPSPAIYLRALTTLGANPQNCVAIEDAISGIHSAQAAGLFTIWFSPRERSARGLDNSAALPLSLSHWLEIGYALYGYQTFSFHPQLSLEVVDSREGFGLSDVEEKLVDHFWQEAQKRHAGKLFNGQMLNLVAFNQGRLEGTFVEYRYYIAQLASQELHARLNIKPLAINAITLLKNNVLVGRRADHVTNFQGRYELVPSGGIDPAVCKGGVIDLSEQTLIELKEETNIDSELVAKCYPFALVLELSSGIFEICMHIDLIEAENKLTLASEEYSELFWMPLQQLADFALKHHTQFVPLSLLMVDWSQ